MRRACIGVWILLASCGGAPNNPPAPDPAIVLSVAPPPARLQPPSDPAPPLEPARPTAGSLSVCTRQMREASWLAHKAPADPAAADYRAAYEMEMTGRLSDARRAYFEIIQRHPQSAAIPLAYLAFGEMFAAEAENDPSKWMLAQQAFTEVAKYPPPDNHVHTYAGYRLGVVLLKTGDSDAGARALANFKRALDGTRTFPQSECAAPIADAAAIGMVEAYGLAGRPDRAWDFFQSAAPDRAPDMMVDLANDYAGRKQFPEEVSVLQSLLDRQPSTAPAVCRRIHPIAASIPRAGPWLRQLTNLEGTLRVRCP